MVVIKLPRWLSYLASLYLVVKAAIYLLPNLLSCFYKQPVCNESVRFVVLEGETALQM